MTNPPPKVSVILPCLNEETVVGQCLRWAREGLSALGVPGEILVVDNGSSDRSAQVARAEGAEVIRERRRGYGAAILAGFARARGEILVMCDADGSYDLREIPELVKALEGGFDLVLGSRLSGNMERGAMPWMNRHIGNPLLTGILRFFFRLPVRDAHSGFRAIRREACRKLRLRMEGMEFASEMLVAARQHGLRIREVPIRYLARKGRSKLRPWQDGWRHLRLMLLYSPTHLFLIPGVLFFILGLASQLLLLPGPLAIGSREVDVHAMLLGSLWMILGCQVALMGICARIYARVKGLGRRDSSADWLIRNVTLERGLAAGLILFLIGFSVDIAVLWKWAAGGFGALDEFRRALFASTLMILGLQVIFASFLGNLLQLRE